MSDLVRRGTREIAVTLSPSLCEDTVRGNVSSSEEGAHQKPAFQPPGLGGSMFLWSGPASLCRGACADQHASHMSSVIRTTSFVAVCCLAGT